MLLVTNNLSTTAIGLLFQILREGRGAATPTVGCEVFVDYCGKFKDGTIFDDKHRKGEPQTFNLGKGESSLNLVKVISCNGSC